MAILICSSCGKQFTQAAGPGGAPLCAACAKKAASPASKAPAAPAAPAKSAIPEDLELELVKPPEPSAEAQGPRRVPRHRLPEPVSGKPVDAGDPMRLYLIAGVALVATVLGGFWYFLRETPSVKAPAAAPASSSSGAQSSGAKGSSASSGAKPTAASGSSVQKNTGSTTSSTAEPAFNENNPSNKRCFHAYLNFMQWAYLEGTELKSDELLAKYKEQVSVNGVDDPDVKGIYNRGLQVLNIGTFPLKTSVVLVKPGQDEAVARAQATEEAKKRKQLLLEINSMARKAERRYGRPKQPPKPAPEAKTTPAPEPAPAPEPESAKTEAPPSIKPAQ
ncbi:MAG: hypothetical protein L6R28_19935 [Planctomycetes bacterium]|nr:hypothetical protein [Planctomycetota bacterium]